MPAQGQASPLHCPFLGGEAEQGPSAQTSPIPWELHWKTAQLGSILPQSLFFKSQQTCPSHAGAGVGWAEPLQQLRSPFAPQESSQGYTGAAALAGDHLHAVLCQPRGG